MQDLGQEYEAPSRSPSKWGRLRLSGRVRAGPMQEGTERHVLEGFPHGSPDEERFDGGARRAFGTRSVGCARTAGDRGRAPGEATDGFRFHLAGADHVTALRAFGPADEPEVRQSPPRSPRRSPRGSRPARIRG